MGDSSGHVQTWVCGPKDRGDGGSGLASEGDCIRWLSFIYQRNRTCALSFPVVVLPPHAVALIRSKSHKNLDQLAKLGALVGVVISGAPTQVTAVHYLWSAFLKPKLFLFSNVPGILSG